MFNGYDLCPAEELGKTFEEVAGYDDLVIVRDIKFHSHCEHHMVPIIGRAHVGYLPDGKVVGLSKIARVVDIFAHRLQTQEALTAQIAGVIQEVLNPRGVAVMIEAEHMCMAMRGIRKQGFHDADLDLHRRVQGQSRGTDPVRHHDPGGPGKLIHGRPASGRGAGGAGQVPLPSLRQDPARDAAPFCRRASMRTGS